MGIRIRKKEGESAMREVTPGIYLNSPEPYTLFSEEYGSRYFVDKSLILAEFLQIVEGRKTLAGRDESRGGPGKYICITRPPKPNLGRKITQRKNTTTEIIN